MKLLFTHSYFLYLDPKQLKLQQPYPPLATITAAAVLREAGHQVSLHDNMFSEDPDYIIGSLRNVRPDVLVIYDDSFNYLTKMCLTNMREAAFQMISYAKKFGCKVIVASSDAADHFEKYLDHGADFIIIGEAEMTLLELVNALDCHKKDFENIQGLAFRLGKITVKTEGRALIQDLDSLPLPAWDIVNMELYMEAWMESEGYFSLNVATTRGCPFKCNWCAKPIYGNRYHSRSPEHVVDELKMLKEVYGFDHIWFCDDIFGLKPGWIERFAELVEEEGLSFRFKIQSRADLMSKEKTVQALARAGCETVWMGAESGSQMILDAMDKGIKVEQIYAATFLVREHGMKPAFFLQFGYLGETLGDIELTLKMLFELMPDDIGVSVSYPLPGTRFYDKVKEELIDKTNWTDSDDLDLMFHNTYQPEFYKALHRFVHKNFRKKQSIQAATSIIKQPWRINRQEAYKAALAMYYIPTSLIEKWRLSRIN